MSIKQPIYHEFDLNATSGNSRVISLTHTDDAHVDVIELCVKQNGSTIDLTGATVIARMVLHGTTDVLLNDSVACTINSAGNILIPFDNAAIQSRKGIVKIEVNITRTPDILTLQLPLWVKINGSILDDATVDPHSEGTIPELLKDAADALEEATQALEQAGDYDSLEHKPQINSHTLSGNKSSDDLGLQKKLTAGTNITLESDGTISASGGVTSYDDLTDKPTLENYWPIQRETNHTLSGTISFYPFTSTTTNGKTYFRLDDVILFKCGGNATISDFNSTSFIPNGAYSCFVTNHPSFMNAKYDLFVIYNFKYPGANGLAQLVFWVDNTTNEAKSAFRVGTGTSFTGVSDWVELTGGGSQIVSGVVNQNGTITFTDSDGNTFTTTGASVIGADGFSPTATVTQTASGATVTITDKNGTTAANISNGAPGQDYVLTAQDKSDIADIVLSELPTTQGVLYGDASN